VECQDARKLEVLLSYLFDAAALQGPCREDWLKLYDKEVRQGGLARLVGSWAMLTCRACDGKPACRVGVEPSTAYVMVEGLQNTAFQG
jgi:hypothetical protein